MGDGIYVALSGALAQQTVLDTTATNLANASTQGYQRSRAVFREVLAGAGRNPAPLRYATVVGTATDTSQGATISTGRGLDAALPAGTYLAVATPRGERYTRACSLVPGTDGTLQTTHGDAVLNEAGQPIRLTAQGEATLGADGSVMQNGALAARLRLVTFQRPDALVHEGGTLLVGAPAAGNPALSREPIAVGALEDSNTSVVGSMTDLVTASRTFEAFQKAIDTFREADRKIVTVPGGGGG